MVDERRAAPAATRVFAIERRPDLGSRQLLAGRVGDLLDDLAELDLQKTRQRQAVVALEEVGDAALARLAVHADHRVVGAADVGRVDRQIRHVPFDVAALELPRAGGETLLDRVLVRAGERGEHELAAVRMPRVERQLVAVLDRADHLLDIGEIDSRIDPLREEVEAERDEADVAGALAVAEEASLDALGPGHQRELGRRDAAAAIVVRMHRHDDAVAAREMPAHPLDLVGVDVGRGELDRRRAD